VTQNMLKEWVMKEFEELALKAPFANERVQLGFAFDGMWLPKEVLVPLFEKVKGLGVKTITTHYTRLPLLRQLHQLLF
jgi:hypothetical protein